MPAYMYIDPFFGALAAALILGAFAMKVGRRKFRKLHYTTGLAAFAAALTAIGIALRAPTRFSTEIGDPFDALTLITFGPHAVLVAIALLALLAQVNMGVTMLLFKRTTGRVFSVHRLNARLLVGLILLAFLLGLATVGLMLVKA